MIAEKRKVTFLFCYSFNKLWKHFDIDDIIDVF